MSDVFIGFLGGVFLGFLIGLLICAVVLYFFSQANKKKSKEIADTFLSQVNLQLGAMSAEALSKNSEQFFSMAKETLSSQLELGEKDLETKKLLINQTLEAMKKELDGVSSLVSDLEKDREKKFGELTEQLKQAVDQTGQLQKTTENLRIALSNTRTRGQWGERMAEDVLRAAGFIEGVNYLKQEVLVNSRNRPDYTFLLPRGRKVNMDVKFPLDNYLKYLESETDEVQRQYRDRFMHDVRNRIKEVTSREYIDPSDCTISYMIVFIPNEQLFAFIHQEDSKILDSALQSKVILCSPMTLFAILSVIRQAIDNFYLEERTLEVLKVFDAFHKHWIEFINSFENLGKKIDAVQGEYSSLVGKRRSQLDRQLIKIDELRHQKEEDLQLDSGDGDTESDRGSDGTPIYEIKGLNQE
jgi:DNA recombination protein RmuC